MELSALELRIIGVLLEKELTTPDQYPLSLNSLTTGCNQKSSREPVMDLSGAEVQDTIDVLVKKGLVSEVLFGSRVAKYKHRFCNTEFSQLHLNPQELACICVLFLRGAQSAGELCTRTSRLHNFADVSEVEATLETMQNRDGEPWVQRLTREPGKRDCRYRHLFGDQEVAQATDEPPRADSSVGESTDQYSSTTGHHNEISEQRISALEAQVKSLQEEVDHLKALWRELSE